MFSCEEQGLVVNCTDCTTEEPINTKIYVKLDAYSYAATRIKVYEGNIEDSVIYSSFSTSASWASIPVSINKKYTITATYFIPPNDYIAVDSATPKVKFEKEQCDDPCYYVYDKKCDLRLKHYK